MELLIADDHRLVAQALSNVLTATDEYQIELAASYSEAMQAIVKRNFDIILLDLKMPGMVGLTSVTEIVRKTPDSGVVIFSGNADEQFVRECVAAGARGFIPKSMDVNAVHIALQLMGMGQKYVPFENPIHTDTNSRSTDTRLTERELNILRLAALGETNKEIARSLATTETLIKMKMRNICAKLGARNRAHACIIGRERLLI